MADAEETMATKSQVWRNVALSIKLPPSNTRGRQSGGARVINTRMDYSMASTFGTNQKIMIHGLRSSRAAYLRKIKLWRLLQRLLRRDPNKGHLTNWRYLSTSRNYYVPTSCYLMWMQINTARKSVNQKILGPELRIWHKIGYTLCILYIASLRLAELIILSNQSPWKITIVNDT